MDYIYTNLLGSFVLDNSLKVKESVLFESPEDYLQKEKIEQKLNKKYPHLQKILPEKLPLVLSLFKDQKYASEFHQRNIFLTKQDIKASVSDDLLIMQTIASINELDKVSNLLSKRVREWYELYFPELSHQIKDHAKFVDILVHKSKKELIKELNFSEENLMGANLDLQHVEEIKLLAKEVLEIYSLRKKHEFYLEKVMKKYCPNLLELAGATIGAKLMEMGRGLKHLALLPASTIQLLGAEKALFRHIRTGAKSPKYGIIINHPLVQNSKEKGRAARVLADKISLCARLDFFKGEFKAKEYKKELEEKFKS